MEDRSNGDVDEHRLAADADRDLLEAHSQQTQRAAERATDLTHQLLAFARREVVQPRVLDLNDAVTDVDDLWPILADPGQIE